MARSFVCSFAANEKSRWTGGLLPVIWDAMAIMWRHCNDLVKWKAFIAVPTRIVFVSYWNCLSLSYWIYTYLNSPNIEQFTKAIFYCISIFILYIWTKSLYAIYIQIWAYEHTNMKLSGCIFSSTIPIRNQGYRAVLRNELLRYASHYYQQFYYTRRWLAGHERSFLRTRVRLITFSCLV